MLEYFKKLKITCCNSGGSPYPRMDGRKIANLLQEGYRMPKPQHLDDKLYVNMVLLWLVFGFSCLFVCFFFLFDGFYRTWYLSCFCSGCICTSRFTTFTYWTSLTKGNERRKKASSSRIGWTVSRPPMTTEVFITSLCFRYEIMKKCWRDKPNLRPSFEELRNKLSKMENQHKVELKSFQRDSLSLPIFFLLKIWTFESIAIKLTR